MKLAPEQIIINFELQKFKQKIFLISGNEETYIKKIEESLICGLKNTIKTEIIRQGSLNVDATSCEEYSTLFSADFKIYIFNNPKDVDIEYINGLGLSNFAIIISHSSIKTSSKLKKFFDQHDSLVSITCYKLSRENKTKLLNYFLKKESFEMLKECYWYLVDNSSDYYQLFENEIIKISLYKEKIVTIDEIKALLSLESSSEIDSLFFLILSQPEKIIYQSQKIINSPADSFILIQRIKFFLDILYKSRNREEVLMFFPKYMFKNKVSFLEIFNKATQENVLKVFGLIKKTEILLKKHNSMYLLISQRFLLNIKKSLS